jgi:hypothetical protein
MNKNEWNAFQWCQHKAIHLTYDLLVFLHDALIEWACARDLWRTPEERAEEGPPKVPE